MKKTSFSIRKMLFGASVNRIPWWALSAARFIYLTANEFSRNRCPEKASALGFQTVFSLIPAIFLTLIIFVPFGDSSAIGAKVSAVFFQILLPGEDSRDREKDPTPALETNALQSPPDGADPAQEDLENAGPSSDPVIESPDQGTQKSEPPLEPRGTAGTTPKTGSSSDPQVGESGAPSTISDDSDSVLNTTPDQVDTTGPRPDQSARIRENIEVLVAEILGKFQKGGLKFPSFVILCLAAMMLGLTLEKSLDDIWQAKASRGVLRRIAVYWSVFTLGPLLIGLSLYGAEQVSERLAAGRAWNDLVIELIGPSIALYLVYQLVPVSSVQALPALGGAFVAAVLWNLAGRLFAFYLDNLVGYESFYGNLGLIPIFLLWVWILWSIVLIGATIAYNFQHYQVLVLRAQRQINIPMVQPGFVALALVLQVARSFDQAKGPVPFAKAVRYANLPDTIWVRVIELLVSKGILLWSETARTLMPARPLEKIQVDEIFRSVEDVTIQANRNSPDLPTLERISTSISAAREQTLANLSIAELLAREPDVTK